LNLEGVKNEWLDPDFNAASLKGIAHFGLKTSSGETPLDSLEKIPDFFSREQTFPKGSTGKELTDKYSKQVLKSKRNYVYTDMKNYCTHAQCVINLYAHMTNTGIQF